MTSVLEAIQAEKELQSHVINYCKESGVLVVKIMNSNVRGFPDLLIMRGDNSALMEIKTKIGILSRLQKKFISDAKEKHGVKNVYVVDDFEKAKGIIDGL